MKNLGKMDEKKNHGRWVRMLHFEKTGGGFFVKGSNKGKGESLNF